MKGASSDDWRTRAAASGIEVEDLAPTTASRVGNVDLAARADDELVEILKTAVAERVLLVFPDQTHLAPADYLTFATRFGGVPNRHSRRDLCLAEHHEIFVVGNVEGGSPKVGLNWHTDDYQLAFPGLYTFLHAVELPPVANHTSFANGVAACAALDDETRRSLDGVHVRHSRRRLYTELFTDASEEDIEREAEAFPDVVHPLVRTVPELGGKGIFLGGEWGSGMEGMDAAEGEALYARLLAHMIDPRFVYRHRWRPGDVLFSDNRCSLHRADEWDTERHRRRLHRIILWDTVAPA